MTAGTPLNSLKNDYHTAEKIVAKDESKGLIRGVVTAAIGLVAFIPVSLLSKSLETGMTALYSLLAASLFFVLAPHVLKNSKSLKANRDSAHAAYSEALTAEISSYGIDTESIVNHTEITTKNHEFTALRNGEPVDVTVREFNNDVVFMLDGKLMEKPVAV